LKYIVSFSVINEKKCFMYCVFILIRYDDTYDDLGAGMTEPDNNLFNPLNRKKVELVNNGKDSSPADDEDEEEPTSDKPNRNFDAFCEDPSVVRERFERRRQDMQSRGGGGRHHQQQQNPQPIQRDVVGEYWSHLIS
jgi:hypothetical protein